MSEEQRWSNFNDQCEDKTLKMDEANLKNLGFERVHSNFEYFDDGTFTNLAPFTDISTLMGEVSSFINWYLFLTLYVVKWKDKYYHDEIYKQASLALSAFA